MKDEGATFLLPAIYAGCREVLTQAAAIFDVTRLFLMT
jgi:hypothetical protein